MSAVQLAHAESGCLAPEISVPQAEIDSFLAAPDELLHRYPNAGPPLSARVQRLAASDTSVVPTLIALTKRAKTAHVVAIGIGLGRAAGNCAKKRPDLTSAIARLVTTDGSPSLRALFSSEAAVTEMALGAPSVTGQLPATGAPDQRDGVAPPDTAVPSLEATLAAPPPGFLLPTAAGALPAQSGQATGASLPARAPYQGPSGPPASTPLLGELEAYTGPVEGMSTFFTAAGPGEPDEHPPAHGDEIGAMHFIAKETASDERALRRSLFSAPEDTVPSFGTGGVVSASGSVISPTR